MKKGVFQKGHETSQEVRDKIAKTLDKSGVEVGQIYGLWTIIERRETYKNQRYWLCRCECGVEKEVSQRNFCEGRSTCCLKCSGKKHTKRAAERNTTEDGRCIFPSNGNRSSWYLKERQKQLEKQQGICSICLKPLDKTKCFDHDHETGKCRELVHRYCNVFIGFVENHEGVLDRIKEYLGKYAE